MLPSMCLGDYIEPKVDVLAANGISKYTAAKIARDHEAFKRVIAKHYHTRDKSGRKRPPNFQWKKIFTHKFATHVFSHSNPKAPTIIIKRRHLFGKPLYHVRVRIAHPTKEGKFIYNRKFVTSNPSKHLNRMLGEARWSQHTGKQFRRNHHQLVESTLVQAKPLTAEQRNNLPASDFVFSKSRKFPIADISHAKNALSRASAIGGWIKTKVFHAVYERYPELKPG